MAPRAQTAIAKAIAAGDTDAIDVRRAEARDAGADELAAFEADYAAAWAKYQADNEASEDERVANAAAAVEAETPARALPSG